jgi:hypothetical protein
VAEQTIFLTDDPDGRTLQVDAYDEEIVVRIFGPGKETTRYEVDLDDAEVLDLLLSLAAHMARRKRGDRRG